MHHFLKTVLLSCALLTLGAMPSQSAESLRCVSAANPSGTWYIGMGAVGKAYTNMNPGTDVTMRRCDQCAPSGLPRRGYGGG